MDVDSDVALKRVSKRNNGKSYFERKDFLDTIRENYKILASKNKNCYIIDGNNSEEEVSKVINSILKI